MNFEKKNNFRNLGVTPWGIIPNQVLGFDYSYTTCLKNGLVVEKEIKCVTKTNARLIIMKFDVNFKKSILGSPKDKILAIDYY